MDAEDLQEIIAAFVEESSESLDRLDQDLVSLEENAKDTDRINRIFRNFHTIKGNANFLNSEPIFAQMAKVAHAAEDVMGEIRAGKIGVSHDLMDAVLAALDTIKKLFAQVQAGEKEPEDYTPLVQKLRSLTTKAIAATSPTPAIQTPAQQPAISIPAAATQTQQPPIPHPTPAQTPITPISIQPPTTSQPSTTTPQPSSKTTISPPSPPVVVQSSQISAPSIISPPSPPVAVQSSQISTPSIPASKTEQPSSQPSSSPTPSNQAPANDYEDLTQDFIQESKELIERADQDLVKLEKNPQDQKLLEQIFRTMHTIKGTTAFLGYHKISELTHAAEDVMKDVSKGNMPLDARVMDGILAVIDFLKNFFKRLETGDKDEGNIQPILQKLQNRNIKSSETPQVVEKSAPPTTKEPVEEARKNVPAVSTTEQTIRVETTRLDKLMNLVGELVLGRNRLVQVLREMSDKIGDDRVIQDMSSAVDFLDFVTSDLQRAVLKTRMQPISKIFNRFSRTVRDLAKELGKEVKLIIEGAETELDKSVIDELSDPLTHLLRNSVDHGVEMPEVRHKAGKNPIGTVVLSATHEGNHILISLKDDGKGIDHEIIKNKAIKNNIISPAEAQRMSRKDILDLIYRPGFSTAEKVTNVSGRGVGMDVVKTSIEKLNGSVEISTEIGKGSTFTIRLPLTLAIIQALQIQVGNEIFAMPLTSVIETLRLHPTQLQTVSGREVIRFRNTIIPLIRLYEIFNIPKENQNVIDKLYIVVAGMADKKIGLVVDKIVGQEEVVVKSMGKLLENTPGISGACIGGDGKITLILDLSGLLKLIPQNSISGIIQQSTQQIKQEDLSTKDRYAPTSILLVEDSRSERKRARMTLEAKGYRVIEATDGREALTRLMDYQVDMVITDIEMPELDGYRLTAKIRENRKFKNLPVIAISSHKEMIDRIKGMEAGINAYLPKPFDEDELFSAIKSLLS